MNTLISDTVVLLLVAIVIAIVARRVRLPYTVGLVVAGIGISLAHIKTGIVLTHDIIFDIILPPLLFEAAINIEWPELRRDLLPVLTLAVLGVTGAALVVALGVNEFLDWPFGPALVFGVLIAATDPVAVIAMFKDTGIGGRLRLLVESESLLNDGVAAVLFVLALGWVQANGQTDSPLLIAKTLAVITGGGLLTGIVCGGAAILLAGRTQDRLVQAALTIAVAYGSFFAAEHFGCSGVLAVVAAGLAKGNYGLLKRKEAEPDAESREFILALWEFIAFLANSIVFLLIGLAVAMIPLHKLGLPAISAIIGLVLLSRALTVYPLCLPFRNTRWAVTLKEQHVLWWGGLRGALGLALALSLPPDLPMRDEIVIATFGVVAFSVVVQGVSMPLLLRLLGFAGRQQGNSG